MVCLRREPISFCHFWDCTQVLHFGLLLTMKSTPFLPRDSCPQYRYNDHLNQILPFLSILLHWFLRCQRHFCHLLFYHVQFTLTYGPNFPDPYAIYSLQYQTLFSPSDTFTAEHCFFFGVASSFFLELFLCSSPLVYWAPTDRGGAHLLVLHLFAFSYCPWGSQGKNAEVV